jgi:hypothetical protein
MQLPDRTIRDVRAELKIWGTYWYNKEQLGGYASRSACDKLGEVMTNSDSHLYEQELTPPPFVQTMFPLPVNSLYVDRLSSSLMFPIN